MSIDSIVASIEGDPRYVRFLLLQQPYIRSALYARGVSLDEEYLTTRFSGEIGNSFHLDLIEVEVWLSEIDATSRRRIVEWVLGEPSPHRDYSRSSVRRHRAGAAAKRVAADLSERLSGVSP